MPLEVTVAVLGKTLGFGEGASGLGASRISSGEVNDDTIKEALSRLFFTYFFPGDIGGAGGGSGTGDNSTSSGYSYGGGGGGAGAIGAGGSSADGVSLSASDTGSGGGGFVGIVAPSTSAVINVMGGTASHGNKDDVNTPAQDGGAGYSKFIQITV